MSYTNRTPNLGLPQYQSDDKPSWLEDINGAFRSIDSSAGNLEGEVANARGEAAEAKQAAADASNAVTEVVEKQGEVEEEVGRLGSDLNLTKQAVEDNTAAIEELQTGGGSFNPIIPQGGVPREYLGVSLDFIRGKADTMSSYLVKTEDILVQAGQMPFDPMPDEFVLVVIPGSTSEPDKGIVQMAYDLSSNKGRFRTLGTVWSGWTQMDGQQLKTDIAALNMSISSLGTTVVKHENSINTLENNRVYCSYTRIPALEIETTMSIKEICQKLITSVGTGGSQTKSVTVHLWCNTSTTWGNEIREVFPSVYGELTFFATGRNVWLTFRPYEENSGGGNVYPVAYNSYTNENNFDRMATWVVLKDWSQRIMDIEGDVSALEADVAGIINNYLSTPSAGWHTGIAKTGEDNNRGIALDVVNPEGDRSRVEATMNYVSGLQKFWYTSSDGVWHEFRIGTNNISTELPLTGTYFFTDIDKQNIIIRFSYESSGTVLYDLHIRPDGLMLYRALPGEPFVLLWTK